jgi:alpha-L-rhamnosidase
MSPRIFLFLLATLVFPMSLATAGARPARSASPVALQCDFRVDPLGVDSASPRLSWQVAAVDPDARGLSQTAYRILVASSPELLARGQGDLWDSGRVVSGQATLVAYAGRRPRSSEVCHWKVQVWTDAQKPSPWSPPARWTMGLVAPGDWQARWIGSPTVGAGPDPASILLRREFAVGPRLARALVHVTGLGHYELFLNGRRVGEDLLAPGWTDYRKTILYDTFDVTAHLRAGANAAGIVLGNGMYRSLGGRYSKFTGSLGPQKAIAHLRLDYDDGTVETVATDEAWRVAPGPIVFSDVYGGEDYDARLAPKRWDEPGFDASAWSPAAFVPDSGARLAGLSESAPPIRAFQTLAPVSAKELRPGVTVYDLGQNASLLPRLAVRGPAGATVRITPSELLRPDGEINDTMCGGKACWTYTLSGEGAETWFPQFFYRGARYLRVECTPPDGASARPVVASIEGVVVRSSSPLAGEFSCSSELFNRTHRLVHWAQLSNLVSVISDCPTREKLGWLEQYHLNGPALRYEWGLDALYTKCLTDIADAQTANGMVPSIAPEFVKFGATATPTPSATPPSGAARSSFPRGSNTSSRAISRSSAATTMA